MLTSIGKFLRKLRIDRGEILKDMAEKLDVTVSFLSAVENGRKKMPSSWNARICSLYDLSFQQQKDFTKAIEIEPKYVSAYINRSVAYIMLGNSQKAIADCTRAIDLDSKEAIAYYNRGVAYKKLGNIVQANADFAMAKSLGYTP